MWACSSGFIASVKDQFLALNVEVVDVYCLIKQHAMRSRRLLIAARARRVLST